MVDPVGGADYNAGTNTDSSSLAWSSGAEVPDVRSAPAGDTGSTGHRRDAAGEPATVNQPWSTVWGRSVAVLLICLGVAAVIVVVGLVLVKNKSTGTAATPRRTTTAAAATTTSIASTPDQDSRYVTALNEKGIVFSNPDVAISNGKAVCQSFAAQMSLAQVVAQVRKSSPDFAEHAEDIVAISVRAYCPEYSKLVAAI